ncbi:hypothetical protein NH340_JMT05696 [Sarcoptes scabiei]|nr:hypothetical protein NH340_JMT05696 [Sarcoptes scabiei]
MKIFIAFVLIFSLLLVVIFRSTSISSFEWIKHRKIQVKLYYETGCPDCQSYYTENYFPAYVLLHREVRFKLIPFGKARIVNSTLFKCQHGPSECFGNIYHACCGYYYGNKVMHRLAYCMYRSKNWYREKLASRQCSNRLSLNDRLLRSCTVSDLGRRIFKKMAKRTKRLGKPLRFVPYILVEGRSVDPEVNLHRYICKRYRKRIRACRTEFEETINS